jgi:ankyrin repeat protein
MSALDQSASPPQGARWNDQPLGQERVDALHWACAQAGLTQLPVESLVRDQPQAARDMAGAGRRVGAAFCFDPNDSMLDVWRQIERTLRCPWNARQSGEAYAQLFAAMAWDPHEKLPNDSTLVHMACWLGREDVLRALQGQGVNLLAGGQDSQGRGALDLAASYGHEGCLLLLLSTPDGVAPELMAQALLSASSIGESRCAALLARPDNVAAVGVDGKTALALLCEALTDIDLESFAKVAALSNPNALDRRGRSPLALALLHRELKASKDGWRVPHDPSEQLARCLVQIGSAPLERFALAALAADLSMPIDGMPIDEWAESINEPGETLQACAWLRSRREACEVSKMTAEVLSKQACVRL